MQEPESILDRRLKNKGRRTVSQLLIKWAGWPPELTTWEDEDQVCHLLPAATACVQAVSQGGKNVKRLFYFYIFQKEITEIYFWFLILQLYSPTARQGGGRVPTARQGGGRDLYINILNFFYAEALGRSLPPNTAGTCRPVEGRQAPPKYKN